MIPQKFVDFIHGPRVIFIGTRNEKLRPAFSWAFGAVADAEADTVTVFVPDIEGEQTLANVKANGHVSLTIVDPSHEAYQFKGTYIDSRPSGGDDRAIQEIYLSKIVPHFAKFGFPEELMPGFVMDPSTALTFRLAEIYVQTPGPGAGDRIDVSSGE